VIASEIINREFPHLLFSDKKAKGVRLIKKLNCLFLPVVKNGLFKGFVANNDLISEPNPEKTISEFALLGKDCKVSLETHFLDILKLADDNKMNIVGVVSPKGNYIGVVTVQNIINIYSHDNSIEIPRSVLILSMNIINYSLAEICRYVEESNAKVISSFIIEDSEIQGAIKVVLVINQNDLSRIVVTLERFNYQVVGVYQKDPIDNTDSERMALLMKYINI